MAWSAIDLWNEPSWSNLGFLLWDVAASAIPYVPGSYVKKAGTLAGKVDDVYDAVRVMDVAERKSNIIGGRVIMSYKKLKNLSAGTGLEAHHLIEKRFADKLGINADDILSAAIPKEVHQKIINRMREKIPYGSNTSWIDGLNTHTASKEDIWIATRDTYEELGLERFIEPVKEMFTKIGVNVD